MTMAAQVRSAVAFVYRNAASFGGDPNRLHVSGHSLRRPSRRRSRDADWRKDFGLPAERGEGRAALLGHVRPQAGAALGPFQLCQVHRRDRAGAERATPSRPARNVRWTVGYGTCETPEFQRQARDFAAALTAAGKPVQLLVGEGYNHFEMLETLANPYGLLGRAALAQMAIPR